MKRLERKIRLKKRDQAVDDFLMFLSGDRESKGEVVFLNVYFVEASDPSNSYTHLRR